MTLSLPCLYSFRRCPYAMRARLAILFAELQVELREVSLKNKPVQLLQMSPKGTVPVLQLSKDRVIEESFEIVQWALENNDPQGLLNQNVQQQANELIKTNDHEFKHWLDRYKYADRYPAMTEIEYRQKGETFIQSLERLLTQHAYLLSDKPSIADISIVPFVRQFAHVNREVFYNLPYSNVQQWLTNWLQHPLFVQAMTKYKPWEAGDKAVIFPTEIKKPLD